MVPFGVPIIIRHLLFRVPPKGTIVSTTTHLSATDLRFRVYDCRSRLYDARCIYQLTLVPFT